MNRETGIGAVGESFPSATSQATDIFSKALETGTRMTLKRHEGLSDQIAVINKQLERDDLSQVERESLLKERRKLEREEEELWTGILASGLGVGLATAAWAIARVFVQAREA